MYKNSKLDIEKNEVFIPEKLKDKYKIIFGNSYDEFIESCKTRPKKAIRINKIKCVDSSLVLEYLKSQNIEFTKFPILEETYLIESNVSAIGNTIEHLAGLFSIQEISSLIPAHVLDPKEDDIVLDLTAAPGNKTIYLAQLMNNKGLIVANDVDKDRIKTLIYNLKKQGVTNTIVTNKNGINFNFNCKFNKILLDAPCSCEGIIRRKNDILKTWNENEVLGKAILQKKLIINAFNLLETSGQLVYSTCTISPEENEEVIMHLLENEPSASIEKINLKLEGLSNGLTNYKNKNYNSSLKNAIRIFPHKTNLEAFFICKIKKN
ncbi:MAG: RsmB/NOP family class I SAM-dependent RNA methyltransferase [archaeon]